jgi:hypothetical protein
LQSLQKHIFAAKIEENADYIGSNIVNCCYLPAFIGDKHRNEAGREVSEYAYQW